MSEKPKDQVEQQVMSLRDANAFAINAAGDETRSVEERNLWALFALAVAQTRVANVQERMADSTLGPPPGALVGVRGRIDA